MRKKRNNSRRDRNVKHSAKKDRPQVEPLFREVRNLAGRAVPIQFEASAPEELEMVCPDPFRDFEPLTDYAIRLLKATVIVWLDRLCKDRGAQVDSSYWKTCTERVLRASSCEQAFIIPARAGSGKSTWIMALLLALCELCLGGHPLAIALGGVLIVVQKVETLNEILATIEQYFPAQSTNLMAALQSWSLSGKKQGFCRNDVVDSFEKCPKERCPYASECRVLNFNNHAAAAYIVGITQARFNLLRRNGKDLSNLLLRDTEQGKANRRFLIFDEKFDLAQTAVLDTETINNASTYFERMGRANSTSDKTLRSLQTGLSINIERPFQKLRMCTVYEDGKDQPCGLCTLHASNCAEAQKSFTSYCDSFAGYRKCFSSPALQDALDVTDALYQGRCLFSKTGNFRVLSTKPVALNWGQAQTIIFDATAEVDGDYAYLPDLKWLPSSPALHMDRVTFHIYTHRDLNVSRSAMQKSWKLPGFAALIQEIVAQYPAKTFLCSYKDFSEELLLALPSETVQYLATMPGRDTCLPYFGGTNGANCFNDCHNVILLGYPRFDPATYLFKAYAVWHDHGLADELEQLTDGLLAAEHIPRDILRKVSMLQEYESRHLAARLEQEIYRCALRNQKCAHDIHIFLFLPPKRVWELLSSRFTGCQVEYISELSACVTHQRDIARTYARQKTAYSRFADFLSRWDGRAFKPAELREKLAISEAAWKELRKDPRFDRLLEIHGITECGRGRNAVFCRTEEHRAS